MERKIYMSSPTVDDSDIVAVTEALRGGWIAPVGPQLDAFEEAVASLAGVDHAVALASGTAALELGMRALGVSAGDDVLMPTLTFAATAFATVHLGANPVFIDVENRSWGMDPDLLASVLDVKAHAGTLPAAVVPVDVIGRTADYDRILPICEQYGVPVLADAAESLGATHGSQMAGSMGEAAVFSFNGNKIITSSGGGMLVTSNADLAEKVRFWSTQARASKPWYEHHEIGHNYRMSNILAALGHSQLRRLPQLMARRTQIHDMYRDHLEPLVEVVGNPPWGRSNNWLTCVMLQEPGKNLRIQAALADQGIEVRPVWKAMHGQPVFAGAESHLTGVADDVFASGLCLPSGVGLTDDDVWRVIEALKATL